MTQAQFVQMIEVAESAGKLDAIGDHGLAAGAYQMHWDWRKDFWPAWAWQVLALLDRWAIEYYITHLHDGSRRPPTIARELADNYNLGHPAPDPAYDARCLRALSLLGIDSKEFDTIVA